MYPESVSNIENVIQLQNHNDDYYFITFHIKLKATKVG